MDPARRVPRKSHLSPSRECIEYSTLTRLRVERDAIPEVVRLARTSSQLSKVAFAKAVGTTRAAVDEYEKGARVPRVDSLLKILEPAGLELRINDGPASRDAPIGLSLASFAATIDTADPAWAWRTLISDFTANEFAPALGGERSTLLADEPPKTGSHKWDSFIASLGEHLAFHARIDPPAWIFAPGRAALDQYWWPVHGSLPSTRAAALGLSPAAFRRRGIAIDGRELPMIAP